MACPPRSSPGPMRATLVLGRAALRSWARPAACGAGALRRPFCAGAPAAADQRPTTLQLRRLFFNSALPFVAFGFVDQTVLIWAGDAIDNTVGVFLGLPTLAAAAMGQVLSDTCGVTFGNTIEAICLKMGLPLPGLTDAQLRLGLTKRVSAAGGICGVILGCSLGMCNLLLVDLHASERAKRAKELETIMMTIMEDGRASMSSDRATLWIVDEDAGEMWSSTQEEILRLILDPDKSVAAWVARNQQAANIPDVQVDPRWGGRGVEKANFIPFNMLCGPVIQEGKTVAVIQFVNKRDEGVPVSFDGADEKVLRMLVAHAAIFMEQLGS